MRNFEERIAEISRRSEKIIQERRRKRRSVLMACISLVLCAGLSFAFVLPGMLSAETAEGNTGATMETADEKTEDLSCDIARIQVAGEGVSLSCTEDTRILQIAEHLDSLTVTYIYSSSSVNGAARGDDDDSLKLETEETSAIADGFADTEALGYTITLTMHDGQTVEYYLAGASLENRTSQQTYWLTERELLELKELLGLPGD